MTTDNHDLHTPAQGMLDWHEPLNENFKSIDTRAEIRDLEENLGTYEPKAGAKFMATDTGKRYLADGTQWTEAPVHLPDVVDSPTYDGKNPDNRALGELWYRSDLDTLVAQFSAGVVDLTTGETIATSEPTDSTSGDDSTSDSDSTTTHRLEFHADDGASWDTYSATIDGTITSTQNLDSGDEITTQSDGTVLVEGGLKGGKDPETFDFEGTLVSVTMSLAGTAYLDGSVIDPADY
jgi:hypothetical protein